MKREGSSPLLSHSIMQREQECSVNARKDMQSSISCAVGRKGVAPSSRLSFIDAVALHIASTYFTVSSIEYSPLDIVSKHEYRADRKAVLDFLPIEKVKSAIKAGCRSAYEFSEYLDVPEQFIIKAFLHYNAMEMI